MKRAYYRPTLACFLMLFLFTLAGCSSEGGFTWKLWGFETHSFTVEDEEIEMWLDTSGYGRYEVELSDDTIFVLRDGETILEGVFPKDDYAALKQEVLAAEGCQIIEEQDDAAPTLFYCAPEEDGYTFLLQISGSPSAVLFSIPGGMTETEALNCAHRLQFTKES